MTTSRILSGVISALSANSCTNSLIALRITVVSSFSPPLFIITYDTRLIKSSPKRICGFITPLLLITSPVVRSIKCPATVVDPMSIAIPNIVSTNPGQAATMLPATPSTSERLIAIVAPPSPLSIALFTWASAVLLMVGRAMLCCCAIASRMTCDAVTSSPNSEGVTAI